MSKTEKIIERIYIAGGIVLATVVIMSMSSCGLTKPESKFKKCCEKTMEEVYKHEGLRVNE